MTVQSAGSQPAQVNPDAIEVMREVGIGIAHRYLQQYRPCLEPQPVALNGASTTSAPAG
jgi:hypothetical protein